MKYFSWVCSIFCVVCQIGTAATQVSTKQRETLPANQFTICDGADERQPSEFVLFPRILKSRLGEKACSATLIANSCIVTAGHCWRSGYGKIVEFNTPASKDGELVHAAPEDVYEMDRRFIKYKNLGAGNDWAVFRVRPNAITGLTPEEAQGGYVEVELDGFANTEEVRIVGYGTDSEGDRNFAQQVSFGPVVSTSGKNSILMYRSDTTGGNSGSGVVDFATNRLIGVHTHGGCDESRSSHNSGTSLLENKAFLRAVRACIGLRTRRQNQSIAK